MHITVFGATGKVGRRVLKAALARGHEVTAFVYKNQSLNPKPSLIIVKGDVRKPSDVAKAISPHTDAVIIALGSWGTPNKDVQWSGTSNIIPCMQSNKITRIVSLTGADARWSKDRPKLINKLSRAVLRLFANQILKDGEKHIKLLENSNLNWTIVRSPIMTNGGSKSGYRLLTSPIPPWHTIPRELVAKCMVDLAESNAQLASCPIIVRA